MLDVNIISNLPVRTRIAPSPTGDPHVGTAYIALFNRCFAHQYGGQFILRIEDTDKKRSTQSSEKGILDSLRWLGLQWDEGPGCEGEFGPYRQSERSHIYKSHIDQLLAKDCVFPCFCTADRLNSLRKEQMEQKQQTGYDGKCLGFSKEEAESKISAGESYVIRMKIPAEGECEFEDKLRGRVSISWSQVDMQVLVKSDGLPTYHFANVVDDHLMKISHVIRGEEWINSTPKHLLLYSYFNWEVPEFYHMPLLRNPDKSKLSKRKNPTSIGYYQAMGYLPKALVNYLGMMGWSMPSGEEKFSQEEMIESFNIARISLGGPIFDIEKLDWLNGKYIREDLDDDAFIKLFSEWAFNDEKLRQIVPLIKQRVERFSDVAKVGSFFISGELDLNVVDFTNKNLDTDAELKILQYSLWELEALKQWDREAIESCLLELCALMELKIRDFLVPLFVSISGNRVSTSVIESILILKLDITRARIRKGIVVLGGISKKQAKVLEKEYRAFS